MWWSRLKYNLGRFAVDIIMLAVTLVLFVDAFYLHNHDNSPWLAACALYQFATIIRVYRIRKAWRGSGRQGTGTGQ